MEKIVKDNMKELFKQFCDAYGIDKPNLEDKTMVKVFFEWLKEEKRDNDKFYLNILDDLGINYENSRTIEVGKNACDSLVIPYRTIIAPKSGEGLEELGNREIVSNLRFHVNLPFLIQKGIHVDHSIPCDVYDTFMTQNPYSFDEIAEWYKLPYAYHNVIVGAYGDVNDAEKAAKRQMMYQFMEKLNPELSPEMYEYDINDKYATIIAADKKTR